MTTVALGEAISASRRVQSASLVFPPMLSRMALEGRAKNEALFREVNERIRDVADRPHTEFLCECADAACRRSVLLTLAAYEAIRSAPTTFFVIDGHEDSELEVIVKRADDYLVVEKFVTPALEG